MQLSSHQLRTDPRIPAVFGFHAKETFGATWLMALVISTMILTGCGDDAFSQISNIEIPPHESLTTISGHFVAGDTILRVGLDKSRDILDPSLATTESENGYVEAFVNDEFLARWTFRSDSSLLAGEFNLPDPLPATPGVRYRLQGQVDGLPLAFAEQIMPPAPAISTINYDSLGGLNVDGEEVSEVRLRLNRPPTGGDYYAFRVHEPNDFGSCRRLTQDSIACVDGISYNPRFIDSPDPLLEPGGFFFLLLDGEDLPGSNYEVILQFFENTSSKDHVLEVLSLTEDGYRYLRSYRVFEDSRFDPFSEPVNVHDNIQEGYGYFMVSNARNFTLSD